MTTDGNHCVSVAKSFSYDTIVNLVAPASIGTELREQLLAFKRAIMLEINMTEDEIKSLKEETRKLRGEGNLELAKEKLLLAAEVGLVDAMVELADLARDLGNGAESDAWIDRAEVSVRPGSDWDHLELARAFTLGLGRESGECYLHRATYHWEQAALAGNPYAQETIALYYLRGLNGCEQDLNKFEEWIKRAIDTGSPRAVYIYAEHLTNTRQEVPQSFINILQDFKYENRAASRLLQKIERRNKIKH